jgi:hypothetical protein
MRNATVVEQFFQMILEAEQHFKTQVSEPLPDMEVDKGYRGIGGMYGGFKFHWEGDDKLVVWSESRVIGGSGEQYEITPEGKKLVYKQSEDPNFDHGFEFIVVSPEESKKRREQQAIRRAELREERRKRQELQGGL